MISYIFGIKMKIFAFLQFYYLINRNYNLKKKLITKFKKLKIILIYKPKS